MVEDDFDGSDDGRLFHGWHGLVLQTQLQGLAQVREGGFEGLALACNLQLETLRHVEGPFARHSSRESHSVAYHASPTRRGQRHEHGPGGYFSHLEVATAHGRTRTKTASAAAASAATNGSSQMLSGRASIAAARLARKQAL